MDIHGAIRAAVENVATHGDTDVFPFPFECQLFRDEPDKCVQLLKNMHRDFRHDLATSGPSIIETLSQVGYTGFRWAAQIEPFWNAYYLACVIMLAPEIEAARLPLDAQTVFSYRFSWQKASGKLFLDSTWRDYRNRCLDLSKNHAFVVVTDIADFYPRVYHHRLENALRRLPSAGDIPDRIKRMLQEFSKTHVSYGLPIGGPASRILAELALADVDEHLARRRTTFCRYADDYALFFADRAAAYKSLVFLSERLFHEGLGLNKKKTRILTADEYRETALAFMPAADGEDLSDEAKLLNLSLRYDPYSLTADEDYEALKLAVDELDILGILGREVAKVAIDPTVSRQAIKAVKTLSPELQGAAVRTVLNSKNLEVLSPVFVTILRLVRSVYESLSDIDKDFVDGALLHMHDEESPLLSIDLNLSYYLQVLGQRRTSAKENLLIEVYEKRSSPLLRRMILLIMADWGCSYWLSPLRRGYSGFSEWEKRAYILASYTLGGDEGRHWRQHEQKGWSAAEGAISEWFSVRYRTKKRMPL